MLACEAEAHTVQLYGFGPGQPGRSAWPCHVGLMCEVTGIIVFCDQALRTTSRILSREHFFPDYWHMRDQKNFCELSPGILWSLQGIYSGLRGLLAFFYEDFNKFGLFCPMFPSLVKILITSVFWGLPKSSLSLCCHFPSPSICRFCVCFDFQLGKLYSYDHWFHIPTCCSPHQGTFINSDSKGNVANI